MVMRAILSLVLLLTLSLGAVACAGGAEVGDGSDDEIEVVASFYPLALAAARVGGDRGDRHEPHSPRCRAS